MEEDLKILTKEEIEEKLKDFSGWKYHDNKISKEFQFESFNAAVDFSTNAKTL